MSLPDFSYAPARIDAAIDQALAEKRIVGTVVLAAHDGQIIHRRAAGYSNRETKAPMNEDAIFRLASITKPIVTAAAMRLVQEGRLDLHAPVTQWLPDFHPALPNGATPEITVHHLLTHTSGMGYTFLEPTDGPYHRLNVSDGLDQPGLSLQENLSRLAAAPLAFEPGAGWCYSLGLDVLGGILERLEGRSLAEIVGEKVTAPLGLADTDFVVRDTSRLTGAYADGQPEPAPMTDGMQVPIFGTAASFAPSRILDVKSYPSGGAGMAGTANDILRFLEAIRTGGAPILDPRTVEAMATDHVGAQAETQGPGWGFGYGWAVLVDSAPTGTPQAPGTLQWGGAYGHNWFIDRANGLSVVALTNTAFEGMSGAFPVEIRNAVMDRAATKPLAALALAAFGIGTTEFVIMGLLPDVARDLGVGIPAAGLLVSGYALGVAFGGLLLGVFIAGNAACALAPGYGWLMAARVVTAFCHAAFLGVGSVIAAGLVPSDKRAQAIALMIGGLTVATVLGVPLGTLLGQAAGWRTTFWAVTVAGLIAFAGLMFWLPKGNEQRRDLRAELRALRALPVWLTLGISVVASTSMFTFFTYITPILTDVSGVDPAHVSGVLLVCGIGLTFGNFIGARLADWRALPSLAGSLAAVTLVLIGFGFIGAVPLLATIAVIAWGIVAFAVCAILQAEAVGRAEAAPNMAATLNIAAFNLGNAMGAGLGAFALTQGLPMAGVPALAGGVAFLALTLTATTIIVTRKRNDLGQCCPVAS